MVLQKGAKLAINVQVVRCLVIWRTIFAIYISDLVRQHFAAPVRRSGLVRAYTKTEQAQGDKDPRNWHPNGSLLRRLPHKQA
jgi:hypothetical protein